MAQARQPAVPAAPVQNVLRGRIAAQIPVTVTPTSSRPWLWWVVGSVAMLVAVVFLFLSVTHVTDSAAVKAAADAATVKAAADAAAIKAAADALVAKTTADAAAAKAKADAEVVALNAVRDAAAAKAKVEAEAFQTARDAAIAKAVAEARQQQQAVFPQVAPPPAPQVAVQSGGLGCHQILVGGVARDVEFPAGTPCLVNRDMFPNSICGGRIIAEDRGKSKMPQGGKRWHFKCV